MIEAGAPRPEYVESFITAGTGTPAWLLDLGPGLRANGQGRVTHLTSPPILAGGAQCAFMRIVRVPTVSVALLLLKCELSEKHQWKKFASAS